jgi:uncharacterized protein (TIGR02452 family)
MLAADHTATQSIRSFEGYLSHSHKAEQQCPSVRRDFSELANGRIDFRQFVQRLPERTPKKLAHRVTLEASNALRFPTIEIFFRHVNENRHLDTQKKKIIALTVREALYATHGQPTTKPHEIHDQIHQRLRGASKDRDWDLSIRWVHEEIDTLLRAAPSRGPSQVADKGSQKGNLIAVFKGTEAAIEKGCYTAPSGKTNPLPPSDIQAMQLGTRMYSSAPAWNQARRGQFQTVVTVVDQDSLRAASECCARGEHPLVYDLANAQHPCGGVLGGAPAQEETIARCSTLYYALEPTKNRTLAQQLPLKQGAPRFRIPETGGIFIPSVTVFRDASNGYQFLENPLSIAIFATAAYNQKPGHWGGSRGTPGPEGKPSKAQFDFIPGTREKLRTQLAAAAELGFEDLVLGAFGCGAFANDPRDISHLYRELLEGEFRGVFKHVTFAILGGKGPGANNVATFTDTFRAPL